MKVLDFDTEPAWMRIHATEIMVINGKGWLEGRLQHYSAATSGGSPIG